MIASITVAGILGISNTVLAEDTVYVSVIGFGQPEEPEFVDSIISIPVGTWVEWENYSNIEHAVMWGSPENPSGTGFYLNPDEWYEIQFTKSGSYSYFCPYHPWAAGRIDVYAPDKPTPKPTSNGGAYGVEQGRKAYESRNYQQAADEFLSVILSYPKNVDAVVGYGLSNAQLAKYDVAIDYLSKGKTNFPNNPDILRALGYTYYLKGDYKTAEDYFDDSLSQDKTNEWTHVYHGMALDKLGRTQEAKEAFQWALAYEPFYDEALRNLGFLLMKEKDYKAAIVVYKDLADVHQKYDGIAYQGIAYSSHQLGDYKAAVINYDKALKYSLPDRKVTLSYLGAVYLDMEKYSDALKTFNLALAIDPNYQLALAGKDRALSGTHSPSTTSQITPPPSTKDSSSSTAQKIVPSAGVKESSSSKQLPSITGTISLDRTVYPIPFGTPLDFDPSSFDDPSGRAIFPIHPIGLDNNPGLQSGESLTNGDLMVYIRVNDPDYDVSNSVDTISQNIPGQIVGPVKISVVRGSQIVVLGYAGGPTMSPGTIDVGDNSRTTAPKLGPMMEIASDAGIFEISFPVRYSEGPEDSRCPTNTFSENSRFDSTPSAGNNFCILQGDVLQVEYTDSNDSSGNTFVDSDDAVFLLRDGVLQVDRQNYSPNSDLIISLIEPDLDLNSDLAESYDLNLISWMSRPGMLTIGADAVFDPEPLYLRETGDSTGVFQTVIRMPLSLSGSNIAGTDDIFLEYVDYSPAESKYVGQTSKVIFVTLSNSGDFNTLGQSELSQTEDDEKLSSKESGGGCLIATATYGTELAPQVQQLRELRDNSLLKTETGSTFMAGFNDFYYSFSPTIADMERQNPVFREAVKIAITPMVSTLSILNHFELDSEVSVLGYGLAIITLNVGMYFVAPTIIILKIRKIF